MAKQRGLHQIKGKVGEYSYYSQTGVTGGLIRKINEGLSARVKSDDAYANTRLNNQEFGAAANVAALLGKSVTPKFRPMILPFSQSKMAKDILKVAREHAENWGQRVVTSADTAKLCEILSAMSKRDASDFLTIGATREDATKLTLSAGYTTAQADLMVGLGITGLTVSFVQYDIATGLWNPLALEMSTGYMYRRSSAEMVFGPLTDPSAESELTEDLDVAAFVPEANHSGHQIIVAVVLAERTINNQTHILQEFCSFVAMPVPANA